MGFHQPGDSIVALTRLHQCRESYSAKWSKIVGLRFKQLSLKLVAFRPCARWPGYFRIKVSVVIIKQPLRTIRPSALSGNGPEMCGRTKRARRLPLDLALF